MLDGIVAAENHTRKLLTLGNMLDVIKHYEIGQTTKICHVVNFGKSKRNITDIDGDMKHSLKAKICNNS